MEEDPLFQPLHCVALTSEAGAISVSTEIEYVSALHEK